MAPEELRREAPVRAPVPREAQVLPPALGQPEVDDCDFDAVGRHLQAYVVVLDVVVDDSPRVNVVEDFCDLDENVDPLRREQRGVPAHPAAQDASAVFRCHHEALRAHADELLDAPDVLQEGQGSNFLRGGQKILVVVEVFQDDLVLCVKKGLAVGSQTQAACGVTAQGVRFVGCKEGRLQVLKDDLQLVELFC